MDNFSGMNAIITVLMVVVSMGCVAALWHGFKIIFSISDKPIDIRADKRIM